MFSIETGVCFKKMAERKVESVEGIANSVAVEHWSYSCIQCFFIGGSSLSPELGLQDLTNKPAQPVETEVVTRYRQLDNGWIQTIRCEADMQF
jgi:hypothetical protein